MKRVLICAARMPEFDREGGSQRIFDFIKILREANYAVSFIAQDASGGERYARILRQMGVATYAGPNSRLAGDEYLPDASVLIASGHFDLAILAFWDVAEIYLPMLRSLSPQTRIIIDSIDLHFLRRARSLFQNSPVRQLDKNYAEEFLRELNIYAAADAVLTVSEKEAGLLNDFLADQNFAFAVPDKEEQPLSPLNFAERCGLLFIGNFRHPPNVQAVEYLCQQILPQLDSALLTEHPLYIVGNNLDEQVQKLAESLENVRLVGWTPSLLPYLQQVRVSLIPLLSGAGTKRKLIQAMLVGTPSVSTSIGAEGLDLQENEHLLIADDATSFAAAISRLLQDRPLWEKLAGQGREHMLNLHGPEVVRARFLEVVSGVLEKEATSRPAASPKQ